MEPRGDAVPARPALKWGRPPFRLNVEGGRALALDSDILCEEGFLCPIFWLLTLVGSHLVAFSFLSVGHNVMIY